jgi:NADH dehydrogenase
VRNYELDLADVAIPLGEVLDPIGVRHVTGAVEAIDVADREVILAIDGRREHVSYDRLVLALGSELPRPQIPGLAEHGFDVDTYAAAVRLNGHIARLGTRPSAAGRATVVVVGAGFTGIEVATEMPGKLKQAGLPGPYRVILVDSNPVVGATIGDHARPVIAEAIAALGIETRLAGKVTGIDATAVTLASGEAIPAQTTVWCAGMRASPLTATLPASRDGLGRLSVDEFMRASGLPNVFAAGDIASSLVDGSHSTVMSCQFARPMGRFAGHNAVSDLFGRPMLELRIDWYVTVLDLGGWGALYTVGWDRRMLLSGHEAKLIKQDINHKRIYPPRTRARAEILAAAAPILQAPPQYRAMPAV